MSRRPSLAIQLSPDHIALQIYELYSGSVLFSTPEDSPDQTSFRLAKMQSLCGPFPKSLLDRGQDTGRYFDPSCKQLLLSLPYPQGLKTLCHSGPSFSCPNGPVRDEGNRVGLAPRVPPRIK